MERFIHEQNLAHFLRRLLAEQKDMNEEWRQLILKLLADEETKDSTPDQSYPVQYPVDDRRAGFRVQNKPRG